MVQTHVTTRAAVRLALRDLAAQNMAQLEQLLPTDPKAKVLAYQLERLNAALGTRRNGGAR